MLILRPLDEFEPCGRAPASATMSNAGRSTAVFPLALLQDLGYPSL